MTFVNITSIPLQACNTPKQLQDITKIPTNVKQTTQGEGTHFYFRINSKELEKNLRLLNHILKQKAVSNKIHSFGSL